MNYDDLLERMILDVISPQNLNRDGLIMSLDEQFILKNSLEKELLISIDLNEIPKNFQQSAINSVVKQHLPRNIKGDTIVNLFSNIEIIARCEINESIELHWYDKWEKFYQTGNWLNSPDSLDFIEMFMRIEEELSVATEVNSENLVFALQETVGETTKLLWRKLLRD